MGIDPVTNKSLGFQNDQINSCGMSLYQDDQSIQISKNFPTKPYEITISSLNKKIIKNKEKEGKTCLGVAKPRP
jgi:hypothetical protein